MFQRWFPGSTLADLLFEQLRPGYDGVETPFYKDAKQDAMLVGGGMFLLTGSIAALFIFGSGNPTTVQILIALGLVVVPTAIAAGVTWELMGANNKVFVERIFAFDDFAREHNLKTCGYQRLEDAYGVPWFHSETAEIDSQRKCLYALLCGHWQGDEFAWLEGKQLVDPFMKGSDSSLKSLALGVVVKQKNRLRLRNFDSVVFSESLDLPDIVVGHWSIPETGYMRTDLKQATIYDLPGFADGIHWSATSDPRGCENVYSPELAAVLDSRPCVVQVIDGKCVVLFDFFQTGDHEKAARNCVQIEEDLNFAQSIFASLKRSSESQSSINKESQPQSELVSSSTYKEEHYQQEPDLVDSAAVTRAAAATVDSLADYQTKKSLPPQQVIFGAILVVAGVLAAIAALIAVPHIENAYLVGLAMAVAGGAMIAVGFSSDKTSSELKMPIAKNTNATFGVVHSEKHYS